MSETENTREAVTTRVTREGRTTIPEEIRDRLGIEPGDAVEWIERDGNVAIRLEPPVRTKGVLLPDDTTEAERAEVAREMEATILEKRRTDWDLEAGGE
jgi:AbrB family looped-hinge helix DNA binding protein